jgi:hypothetical protein
MRPWPLELGGLWCQALHAWLPGAGSLRHLFAVDAARQTVEPGAGCGLRRVDVDPTCDAPILSARLYPAPDGIPPIIFFTDILGYSSGKTENS